MLKFPKRCIFCIPFLSASQHQFRGNFLACLRPEGGNSQLRAVAIARAPAPARNYLRPTHLGGDIRPLQAQPPSSAPIHSCALAALLVIGSRRSRWPPGHTNKNHYFSLLRLSSVCSAFGPSPGAHFSSSANPDRAARSISDKCVPTSFRLQLEVGLGMVSSVLFAPERPSVVVFLEDILKVAITIQSKCFELI